MANLKSKAALVAAQLAGNPVKAISCFVVALAFVLTLYYLPVLQGQCDYFLFDHALFFEPLTHYIKERIQSGQFPMWNPYGYCGMTVIGNPSPNALYPPYLMFACMSYSQAVASNLLIHQILAATGATLLVLSAGWEVGAAIVCGIVFALSGYMFSLSCNFTLVTTAAWLPMLLFSFRQLKLSAQGECRHQLIAFSLASFSTLMIILAGRPEIFVPALTLCMAAVAFENLLAIRRNQRFLKALTLQFTAAVAGVLISMPLIVPVLEWASMSRRRAGLEPIECLTFSANWYDFFVVAFSQAAGNLQLLGSTALAFVGPQGPDIPYLTSGFVGPIAITLALWGLADKSWKWRGAIATLAALILIMLIGRFCPIVPWLYTKILLLSLFRYPIKWMVLFLFCIAIASARGFYAICRLDLTKAQRLIPVFIWITSALVGAAVIIINLLNKTSPAHEAQSVWLCLGTAAVARSLVGLATCAIAWMMAKQTLSRNAGATIIAAALFLDLIATNHVQAQEMAPEGFFAQQSQVQELLVRAGFNADQRYLPLYRDPIFAPNLPSNQAKGTVFYEDFLRNMLVPNSNIDAHVHLTSGYEASATAYFPFICYMVTNRSLSYIPNDASEKPKPQEGTTDLPLYRLCQSTGTTLLASHMGKTYRLTPKLDPKYFQMLVEDPSLNIRLYKTLQPMPRAYLSQYWISRQNPNQAFLDIINSQRSGYNPAWVTWLYPTADAPNMEHKFHLPTPTGSLTEDRDELIDSSPVKFLVDQPEHVLLSYSVDRPCLLILADHFYPGWQATIDGSDSPIIRANTDVRAVYVPAGTHKVSFDYRPFSFVIGVSLAALGLFIWLTSILAIALMAGAKAERDAT